MKKEYKFKQVTYGYSITSRKWLFKAKKHSFLFSVKGKEVADTISHLIQAGLVRTKNKSIDGLARENISRIVA
jgi:hypothetical protein